MKKRLFKKGQLGNLAPIFTGLATLAIIGVVLFVIMAQTKTFLVSDGDDVFCTTGLSWNDTTSSCWGPDGESIANTTYGYSWNGTGTLQNAAQDAFSFVPLIVIATIGAVLLGIVALFRSRP